MGNQYKKFEKLYKHIFKENYSKMGNTSINSVTENSSLLITDEINKIDQSDKYYLSEKLNGSSIIDIMTSSSLKISDNVKIKDFYLDQNSHNGHSYVVFRTINDKTYLCHLSGIPGSLMIETRKDKWNPPTNSNVFECPKTTEMFMNFCRTEKSKFGEYNASDNNCRNFAINLWAFLKV
jgi:hypothetical protein